MESKNEFTNTRRASINMLNKIINNLQKSKELEYEIIKYVKEDKKEVQKVKKYYRYKVRQMMFNLRKSPELLEKFSYEKLVRLEHTELQPEMYREIFQRKREREDLYAFREDEKKCDQRGLIKCDECKTHNTEYTTLQTRSADEPTTIFVYCYTCLKHWKQCD